MVESRLARWAPVSGIIFFVLMLVGALLQSKDSPDFVGPAGEWVTYFEGNDERITTGALLSVIAVFFLLWFVGTLTTAARRAEGGDGRLSRIAHGGGVAGSALLLAASAVVAVGALRVGDRKDISEDLAAAYGDLSQILGFLAAPAAFAALLAATGLLAIRAGLLPTWFGWLSLVIALGLLIGPVSWAFMPLFILWVLVVSIMLLVRQPRDATSG